MISQLKKDEVCEILDLTYEEFDALLAMIKEYRRGQERGRFSSLHEVYGVLMEEVDEFFDEVRKDQRILSVRELIQVAAVSLRASVEFDDSSFFLHGGIDRVKQKRMEAKNDVNA